MVKVLLLEEEFNNLINFGLTDVQIEYVIAICQRLQEFDEPDKVVDLPIEKFNDSFYSLHWMNDKGGPMINREIQVRFGYHETKNVVVVMSFKDSTETPDVVDLCVLTDLFELVLREELSVIEL